MKIKISGLYLLVILSLSFVPRVWAGEAPVNLDESQLTEVPDAVRLEEKLIAGGKPSARGLGQAAEQGIRTVIDLRDPTEGTAEEKDFADAVGLRYVNIPVTLDSFSADQAGKLSEVLNDPATGPALLHCATGQRAVALWALHKNKSEGVPAETAMAEAKSKGLKKSELVSKLQTLMSQA